MGAGHRQSHLNSNALSSVAAWLLEPRLGVAEAVRKVRTHLKESWGQVRVLTLMEGTY